jgi:DNA-binding CsgD family transcriptional regulator/PAS domain-containing protein
VPRDRDVLRIVGLIYDAAADPSLWPDVLKAILPLGEFNAGTVHFQDLQSHSVGWVSSVNLSADYADSYNRYFASVNPWLRKKQLLVKGRVNVRAMAMSDPEMAATEFWNDWARHLGLFDFAAGILAESGTLTGAITLFRPKGVEPCGEPELALMQVLTPHVIRATELHRRIVHLERQNATFSCVLDHLSLGILIVDAGGRICVANQAAERMLAEADGLSVRSGIVCAAHSADQQRLTEAIAAAADVAAGRGLEPASRLGIWRPSFKPAYSVLVSPSRPQLFAGLERPAAALFITDPAAAAASVRDLLVSLYGLTAAEASLAECLAQGTTLREAAEMNGVSRNTVKSQLQQVFSKTDTHRQAELVRLVSALAGPVQRDRTP